MSEPIISVSGLRGIIGESLTPDVMVRYASAYAACLPAGSILISRDSRPSGELMGDLIGATLRAGGRDVIQASVAATPTTGVLVRHHQCTGGIQISASHNPPEYNGMKLFSADGRVISAESGEEVLQKYRSPALNWAHHEDLGRRRDSDEANPIHSDLILSTVDAQRIRQCQFKVLLDSNHGAGSLLGRYLLEQLGCSVQWLGDQPDGQFAHPPEPTADNLRDTCLQVKQSGADIGFCQDPDADRLAVIDETGRYIGEEYTLVLCLDHVLQSRQGPVVTNCATSRMSEDVAAQHGVRCLRAPVGEANVVELMVQEQAVFGGEGNGGPIDPRVGYVRDSFVGMAQILDAMAAGQEKISRLADQLPRYHIHKTKAALPPEKIPESLERLEREFAEAKADRMDGLRLDWSDQWLLIRASNTEPIVRIIAEASSRQQAEHLTAAAAQVLSP